MKKKTASKRKSNAKSGKSRRPSNAELIDKIKQQMKKLDMNNRYNQERIRNKIKGAVNTLDYGERGATRMVSQLLKEFNRVTRTDSPE